MKNMFHLPPHQVNANLDTEVSNLKYHYQQAVSDKSALSASLLEVTSRAELAEVRRLH